MQIVFCLLVSIFCFFAALTSDAAGTPVTREMFLDHTFKIEKELHFGQTRESKRPIQFYLVMPGQKVVGVVQEKSSIIWKSLSVIETTEGLTQLDPDKILCAIKRNSYPVYPKGEILNLEPSYRSGKFVQYPVTLINMPVFGNFSGAQNELSEEREYTSLTIDFDNVRSKLWYLECRSPLVKSRVVTGEVHLHVEDLGSLFKDLIQIEPPVPGF